MRCTTRYTFNALNALTAVSLLLCVATVALWVCTFLFETRLVSRSDDGWLTQLWSVDGGFGVTHKTWLTPKFDATPPVGRPRLEVRRARPYTHEYVGRAPSFTRGQLGLPYGVQGAKTHFDHGWEASCPYAPVAVLSALAPAGYALRSIFRRRGSRPGLCPRCGYDLRATPDRCPEMFSQ